MSTYTERMTPATKFETNLMASFHHFGYLAARFGQAQIPEDMREHLRRWRDDYGRPTLLRWTPDLIVVRPAIQPFVCLVDAKTESDRNRQSENYSVEINAVDAGLAIVRDLHMPLFYVWPDGGVLTPHAVVNRWNRRLDGNGSVGSETSYYLIARRWAERFTSVFPQVQSPTVGSATQDRIM